MPGAGGRPVYLRGWWWVEALRYLVAQGRYATSAVAVPPLRWLVLGYFAYCLVRKASRVAVVVFAFDVAGVQGSAAVAVAQLLPAIVVAPLGSAFADRFDRSRTLALGYVVQALALTITGVAMQVGAPLAYVAAFSAVASAAFAVTRPVYLATLPDVVNYPDELTLGNAASAWVDGVASVIGPLLAGIGLVLLGAGEVMFGLSIIALLAAVASLGLVVKRHVVGAQTSVRELLGGGLRVLRHDRQVTTLVGLTALQYAVVGLLDVLVVAFVVDIIGQESATAGYLAAAIGVGSTFGGLGSVMLAGRARLSPALVGGAFVVGVPIMLLGLGPVLLLAAVLLAGYGIGKAVVTVASQTLLQRTIDDDVTTRVFGIQEGLIQAGTAAGAALAPALVLWLGVEGALAVTGLLLPIAVVIARVALRGLDARAYVPGPVFALFRRVPFLGVLPLRTLEQLARQAVPVEVAAGADVVRQGEVGDRYYVIETGHFSVSADGAHLRTLGPGDGFGEIALVRDVPRTATVTADEAAVLVAVQREEFLEAVTGTAPAHEALHRTVDDHLDSDGRRALGDEPDERPDESARG